MTLVGRASESKRPSEIIVSAANYAQSSPDVLAKLFHRPKDLVDVPPPPAGPSPVHYYQFLPSEPLAADLAYVEVCKLLLPVLAAKNLFNTAEKAKVDFILRVTFGERRWRDPMVREGDLAWRHGLVPERRATALGAAGVWDDRAGGDELALYALERDLIAVNPGAEGMADGLIGNLPTEDYYLIVVDAFDVATLRQRGNDAPPEGQRHPAGVDHVHRRAPTAGGEIFRCRRPDDRQSRALFWRDPAWPGPFHRPRRLGEN